MGFATNIIFGLRVSDPFYRSVNAQLFTIGLMRLLLNIAILLLIQKEWAGLSMLLMLIACLLLLFSIYSGKNTLNDLLSMSRAPQLTPALAPAPPPRLSIPAVPVYVPPAPNRAIRCALCHTLTDRDDTECHACGLVFASRVPAALHARRDYHALRPLGAGGMSSVYLAQDAAGALCVLKTLLSVDEQSAAWCAEAAACLRHEAALLHQIEHPRIARLLDQVSDARGTFLVLEYVAGETLEAQLTRPGAHGAVLRGAAMPVRAAAALGASVATTLCYLADLPQPVVHCDIKPANLIVPPNSAVPVLVDFGGAIARAADATARLDRYGTPGYAAPEQYSGAATPKSDVYGLAATLYHLLTDDDPGAHPFAFSAMPNVPADLRAALEPALQHAPDARPTAREFVEALTGACVVV